MATALAATTVRTTRRRSLWPREHGAYAQLATPLAAALLVGGAVTPAALLFTTAAMSAFLANEPLLVLLGHRGARLAQTEGPRARTRAAVLGAIAGSAGAAALVLATPGARLLAGLAAVPALALVVLAYRRAQHSLSGELLAAVALPAAALPVATAAGLDAGSSATLWAAWSAGYLASVVAVHRVIARHRRAHTRLDLGLPVALSAACAAAVTLATSWPLAAVAVPLLVISLALVARPPPARKLRAVGLLLVAASLVALAISVAAS
jgi:hypothetical protein